MEPIGRCVGYALSAFAFACGIRSMRRLLWDGAGCIRPTCGGGAVWCRGFGAQKTRESGLGLGG